MGDTTTLVDWIYFERQGSIKTDLIPNDNSISCEQYSSLNKGSSVSKIFLEHFITAAQHFKTTTKGWQKVIKSEIGNQKHV